MQWISFFCLMTVINTVNYGQIALLINLESGFSNQSIHHVLFELFGITLR